MFYVYIEFCLGIRVGNDFRRVVGMKLMPLIPMSILGHVCMIFLQKSDLDRGSISIEGLIKPSIELPIKHRSRYLNTSIELHTSIEALKNGDLSLL